MFFCFVFIKNKYSTLFKPNISQKQVLKLLKMNDIKKDAFIGSENTVITVILITIITI